MLSLRRLALPTRLSQRRLLSVARTTSPETIAALKDLLGDRLSTANAVRVVRAAADAESDL